ncbi:MAG: tyrosine-type recombinase/integrase [Christensenellales bacterium]|jgi:integrase
MSKAIDKRAPKGMGSIRLRKDGRWEARYTIGTHPGTGKQVTKSVYGKTQKDVREKLQRVSADLNNGTYLEPSSLTIGKWLDIWLMEYNGDIKQSTRISYASHIKNHLKPALGAIKLHALKPPVIQAMINDLSKKGLSPKTIKGIFTVINSALTQALKLDYTRTLPTQACTLPRLVQPDIFPLDSDEVVRLIRHMAGMEYERIIKVALFTGMRMGELLGLTWDCVNFSTGKITVEKQLCRPREKGGHFHWGSLKNDKARIITPANIAMQTLSEQKKHQAEDKLKAGSLWNAGDFPNLVFTNEFGRHLHYQTLLDNFRKYLTGASIVSHRFHDLRHTYAVLSIQAGDDIKTVQENLGHQTAAFTLDKYGHVTEVMRQNSADRMNALVAGLNL